VTRYLDMPRRRIAVAGGSSARSSESIVTDAGFWSSGLDLIERRWSRPSRRRARPARSEARVGSLAQSASKTWEVRCCLVAAALSVLLAPAPSAMPSAAVPRGFVGVVGEGPLLDPTVDFNGELDQMVAAGVETCGSRFRGSPRSRSERVRGAGDRAREVRRRPAACRPTGASPTASAARARRADSKIMPVVVEARPGAGSTPASSVAAPRRRRVRGLRSRAGRRYGTPARSGRQPRLAQRCRSSSGRSERAEHRGLLVRAAVAKGLRGPPEARGAGDPHADPRARIVLSGLVNNRGRTFATSTRRWAQVLDTVAYTVHGEDRRGHHDPRAQLARVMKSTATTRKPMVATELTWSSAAGQDLERRVLRLRGRRAAPAARVRVAYERLAAERTSCISRAPTGSPWLTRQRRLDLLLRRLRSVGSRPRVRSPRSALQGHSARARGLRLEDGSRHQLRALAGA